MTTPTQTRATAEPAARKTKKFTRRLRVLVADDEPLIVGTLRIVLESRGYEVAVANSGDRAVAVAARFYPHILVSDVLMPKKDGVQAAMEIRNMFPDCQVLLLTGSPQMLDLLENSRKRGINFALVAKPVDTAELLNHIQRLASRIPPPRTKAS